MLAICLVKTNFLCSSRKFTTSWTHECWKWHEMRVKKCAGSRVSELIRKSFFLIIFGLKLSFFFELHAKLKPSAAASTSRNSSFRWRARRILAFSQFFGWDRLRGKSENTAKLGHVRKLSPASFIAAHKTSDRERSPPTQSDKLLFNPFSARSSWPYFHTRPRRCRRYQLPTPRWMFFLRNFLNKKRIFISYRAHKLRFMRWNLQ